MGAFSALFDYDYALVRVVPRVQVGTFVTVGVVLHARQARFLGARFVEEPPVPGLDADLLRRALVAFDCVCAGGEAAGPIGLLPPSERFHWLTATRSTAIQTSPVHTGQAADLAAALDALFRATVAR
ncbi:MAG TPA: DUF3037 domain-containing protein [Rubricoccaceae bacterium]|nr:DUF3037 domain-containing protein [Rubricoccaceae bacterium]